MAKRTKAAPKITIDFDRHDIELVEILNKFTPEEFSDGKQVFLDVVNNFDCGLYAWLPDAKESVRTKWETGDHEGAIDVAMHAIARLAKTVMVLGLALRAGMPRIGHAMAITKDAAPKARKQRSDNATTRHRTIRAKVQALIDANSKNTLTYAREMVASEVDKDGKPLQSLGTVKTATKGMKTPPGNKGRSSGSTL